MRWRMDGPAPTEDKLKWDMVVNKVGLPERVLPDELRDSIVKRSRKDGIGEIQVRRMTGLVSNDALRIVRRFERVAGGKVDIAEKLAAVVDTLRPEERHFLELVSNPRLKKGVAHLIAEAGAKPTAVMEAYARGAVSLGKVEAAILAAQEQPAIVKDLVRHAIDQQGLCDTCVGSGRVKGRPNSKREDALCPACQGNGSTLVSSKHKEFSMEKLLQINKMIPKEGSTINVQTNVGIKVGGGNFAERMLKASDEVLYGAKVQGKVVQAEVVGDPMGVESVRSELEDSVQPMDEESSFS